MESVTPQSSEPPVPLAQADGQVLSTVTSTTSTPPQRTRTTRTRQPRAARDGSDGSDGSDAPGGSYARYHACITACVAAHGDDALWCIADCDVALRASLAKELNTPTPDPALSLGNAALLMPYVAQRRETARQAGAQRLTDDIVMELHLDAAQSEVLHAYLSRAELDELDELLAAKNSPLTANGTTGQIGPTDATDATDPPDAIPEGGFWQRLRDAIHGVAESLPDLKSIGAVLKGLYPGAREAWTRGYPVLLSIITILAGVYRTWGYGNNVPERPPDSGIGDVIVGGGADVLTLFLVAVAIFASAVLLFSRSIREFMTTQWLGRVLLVLCYVMIAAALVRAAYWGFEEPFRWVTPGLS